MHQLFIRSQNISGTWSRNESYLFTKDFANLPDPAPVNITGIEYFIDTVKAPGTGKFFAFAPATNIVNLNDVVYFIDSLVPAGPHKVWFRSVDANGTWSMLENFEMNSTNMFNQQINIGNDLTVFSCPGTSVDIGSLYDGVIPANGTKSWNLATPTTALAGVYRLVVSIGNGKTDTAFVTVADHPVPSLGPDVLTYVYEGGTMDLNTAINTSAYSSVLWTALVPSAAAIGNYRVIVTNSNGCADTAFVTVASPTAIVSSINAAAFNANVEFTAPDGWTHYYNTNGTATDKSDDILLLSVKKNGNTIGSVGVGTFNVTTAATAGVGGNTSVSVSNPLLAIGTGFHAMHRYWNLTPSQQPTTPVGIRFYYNSQDLADVNGSLTSPINHNQLVFYKEHDGNPDPSSNIQGATYITKLLNNTSPDTLAWVYTSLGVNKHRSEFMVESFSGGSAGFGNPIPLPIKLLSFKAEKNGMDALLSWKTAIISNSHHFEIERSKNGKDFLQIEKTESTSSATVYNYTDKNAGEIGDKLFYRLRIVGLDNNAEYSPVGVLTFPTGASITSTPNPASSSITLRTTGIFELGATVKIIDMNGRVVMTVPLPEMPSYKLDVSNILAGKYQLFINNSKGNIYKESLLIIR